MKIEALHLDFESLEAIDDDISEAERRGFWKPHSSGEPTGRQKVFDWAYGVIIPLICIAADPIVFRSDWGLLARVRPFAYVLSFASILAMAAWLSWGSRLRWLAAPLSGLFFVGGAVSLLVGIVLLPISIFGLFFYFIGFLGFTPLFAAFVFVRNGKRAYKASLMTLENQVAWRAAFLAGLFSFVVPYVINVEIARSVYEIATGDVNSIRRETAKLKFVAPLADLGPVSNEYHRFGDSEQDSPRARELARAYKEIRGLEIEEGPVGWD